MNRLRSKGRTSLGEVNGGGERDGKAYAAFTFTHSTASWQTLARRTYGTFKMPVGLFHSNVSTFTFINRYNTLAARPSAAKPFRISVCPPPKRYCDPSRSSP